MKYFNSNRKLVRGSLLLAGMALSGCSLSTSHSAHLQITMPANGFGGADRTTDLSKMFLMPGMNIGSRAHGRDNNFPLPEQLSDFGCAAIMVTAADIAPDAAFTAACNPEDASGNPLNIGVFGGFVSADGGTIDISVQNGSARNFQLVGVQYTGAACPSIAQLESNSGNNGGSNNGNNNGDNLGNPYVLASVTQDVGGDATISMTPSFSPTQIPAFNCDNHNGGNNGQPQIYIGLENGAEAIRQSTCVQLNFGAQNDNGAPLPPFSLSLSGSTQTNFYTNMSDCGDGTNVFTGTVNASGGMYPQLYLKSTDVSGAIVSVQLTTTATGWTTQGGTFYVVSSGLSVAASGLITLGTCYPLYFTSSSGTISSSTEFEIQTGTNSSAPPTVQVFSDAACTTKMTPQTNNNSGNDGSATYEFNFPSSNPSQFVYVKDANAENLYFNMSATDNSIAPVFANLTFGAAPPLSFSYPSSSYTAHMNAAFPVVFPLSAGLLAPTGVTNGPIVSCTSTPPLPSGLNLNSDCSISGTPTAVYASQDYIITGTSSQSQAYGADLTLVVDDFPDITYYVANPQGITQGVSVSGSGTGLVTITAVHSLVMTDSTSQSVATVSLQNAGTPFTSCSQTSLAATGLNVDPSTCILYGTVNPTPGTYNGQVQACNGADCTQIGVEVISQ